MSEAVALADTRKIRTGWTATCPVLNHNRTLYSQKRDVSRARLYPIPRSQTTGRIYRWPWHSDPVAFRKKSARFDLPEPGKSSIQKTLVDEFRLRLMFAAL